MYAKTSSDFKNFTIKYKNHDPNNLVTKAEKKVREIMEEEEKMTMEKKQEEEKRKKEEEYQQYRQSFLEANTYDDFKKFYIKYKDNDPDNLAEEGQKKWSEIIAKGMMIRFEKAKAEEEQTKKFRKNIQSGIDSHCGLIIETNEKVVKVQTPVGEYWFKKEQLYPPGLANCRFVNGTYMEP